MCGPLARRYSTFQDANRIYMLMEYVQGGELFSHLHSAKRLPTASARFYCACMVSAIEYMHSLDVIYRWGHAHMGRQA